MTDSAGARRDAIVAANRASAEGPRGVRYTVRGRRGAVKRPQRFPSQIGVEWRFGTGGAGRVAAKAGGFAPGQIGHPLAVDAAAGLVVLMFEAWRRASPRAVKSLRRRLVYFISDSL